MDAILNFLNENFWATATIIAAIVIPVTAFLNSKLNPNKIWKQVISWVTAIVFTIGGYYLGVVNMQEPIWLSMVCTGLLVGLEANGIYHIGDIKPMVNGWFSVITAIPDAIEAEKKKK